MWGKVLEEKLLFDPKVEQTACRNNNNIRKEKLLAKKKDLEESSIQKP